MRGVLQAWVSVSLLAALLGWLELPGAAGGRALQGWWLSRQFEAAALSEDSDRLPQLGEAILRRHGSSEALLFAVHRVAFQSTAPSYHLPRAEAVARAEDGVSRLEQHVERLADPWSARRLQSDIIVNRGVLEHSGEIGANAASQWFAAGGGPDWPFHQPGEVYRASLALPAADRPAFLLAGLRIGFGEE